MPKTDAASQPLVSVLTPLYNNAENLAEAIESVLAQTYSNWDYTIINNCSTDDSGKIARAYAAKDPRIKVIDNTKFLTVHENHNLALRQASPSAKYCKMVFADDWIYPQCIEEMVAVAEAHPTVAMVGAYAIEGDEVKWVGLHHPNNETPGREIGRRYFLEGLNVFGTANSLLFRADVVRNRPTFFDESNPHGDRETCIALMRNHNYGFVYQVLTYTRLRPGSLNDKAAHVNSYMAGTIKDLQLHGREFLTPQEYDDSFKKLRSDYYNFLAVSLFKRRLDPAFWAYHRNELTQLGMGFTPLRLVKATLARFCRAVLNPYETREKLQKG